MAQRITITVPDLVHERLQLVKNSLNVSGICQKAIEEAIQLEEIKAKQVPAKEKVIERLRLERQSTESQWLNQGKSDSIFCAAELSYTDFESVWNIYESKTEVGIEIFPVSIQMILRKLFSQYSPRALEKPYLAGWIQGVADFWLEIRDDI